HLLVRGVSFPDSSRPAFAVIVDLVINDEVREQLREETGVELKNVTALSATQPSDARPLHGRSGGDTATSSRGVTGLLSSLPSLMEYRDWATGASGTLTVTTGLSVSELYDRISAAEGKAGRSLGQGLLLLLFVIGALFLINSCIALVAGLA